MPMDLNQFADLMAGNPVADHIRTTVREDQSVVAQALHELRQTTTELEFLSLGHLLFEEDEPAPAFPTAAEIEADIAELVSRSPISTGLPVGHRREIDELWLEASRPLRKWFYETAATSFAQQSLDRTASGDDVFDVTQRVTAANASTSVDGKQQHLSLANWLARVELLRAASPDDGTIALLAHITGRSTHEIAELMGWSFAEAEQRTALATAMIEMLGATNESAAHS